MRQLRTAALVLAIAASGAGAQVPPVPFGPGERSTYDVSLGILGSVGDASMEVVGIDEVSGHPTYHLRFELEGRVTFARVDDTMESWLDVEGLFTRMIHKDIHEVSYRSVRWYDLHPEELWYQRRETGAIDTLASRDPLDEISFLYFIRTLDLEVGESYSFERFFKRSGNPVVIQVLRREAMVGADGQEIPVLVVRPIIQTDGLFGEGGEAEVYVTDDDRRIIVRITARVPVIGRLGFTLTGYSPGERLTELPAGFEEAP